MNPADQVPVPDDPRLLASDLDGTLLRPDGTVGERTRAALDAMRKTHVALAVVTGRPPRWVAPVVAMTGHRGVGIAANGAIVLDLADGRVTEVFPIAADAALDIVERLRAAVPGVVFAAEMCQAGARIPHLDAPDAVPPDGMSTFALGVGYVPSWEPPPDVQVAPIEELVASGTVVKILARPGAGHGFDADGFLAAGHAAIEGVAEATHSNSDDVLLEVSAAGVSKGTTLQWLARSLSLHCDQVLAVGDAPNDLPMLTWAGTAYAVGNAHPRVKDIADHVLPSNSREGVASLIEAVTAQAGRSTSRPPR